MRCPSNRGRSHAVNSTLNSDALRPLTTQIELPTLESLLLRIRANGLEIATATGFVVASDRGPLLVTNRHVVTGRDQHTNAPLATSAAIPDELQVIHNGEAKDAGGSDTIVPAREPLFSQTGAQLWIEHPRHGSRADVVALPLTKTVGVRLYPVTVRASSSPISCRPADNISIVGFPFGKSGPGQMAIWATGFIASEPSLDYEGVPVFLVDSRTRQGQSGAPVFAYRTGLALLENGAIVKAAENAGIYRFLGVYSGRIHSESDIGRVWKASVIEDLVSAFVAAPPV